MAIPSPEGMTQDEFKQELLSALESEHTGILVEIDRRLRDAKILIEGYRSDPIVGFVAVKLDFLRSLRPDNDPYKAMLNVPGLAALKVVEKLFEGLPGYIVVTDSEMRVSGFGTDAMSITTTLKIEHTYVLKDGNYLCEWGDPDNPINKGQPLQKKQPVREERHDANGMHAIRYQL